MSKTFSGQQLRLARLAAGLSLRGLHNRIRGAASVQSLSLYERGQVEPKAALMRTLAAALAVPADMLLREDITLTCARYRATGREEASTRRIVESRIQLAMRGILEAERAVGRQVIGMTALPAGSREPPTSPVAAEAAALALRSHWGLGVAPLPCMVDLLERRGLRVLEVSVEGFDGCVADLEFSSSDRDEGRRQEIALTFNPDHWGERTRFTLAYEIAQLLFGQPLENSADVAAKWFAGALLMPRVLVHEYLGRKRTQVAWEELFEAKRTFGVSIQALTHRCRDIGLFDDKLHKALFRRFEELGWRRAPYEEPFSIPKGIESPRILRRLTVRAVSEGSMSIENAAALFGVEEEDIRDGIENPASARGSLGFGPGAINRAGHLPIPGA